MCEHAHLQREEPTEPIPLYSWGQGASLKALEAQALGIFDALSCSLSIGVGVGGQGGGGLCAPTNFGSQKFGQNSGRLRVNFGRRFGQNVEREKKRQIKMRQIH